MLEKSEAITKEEVSELERKMRQIYFKYEDVVMGKVLRDHMNSRFNNSDWQVIMSPGEEFYVPAKKYACIKAANTEALVYSMK